jgi:AbrB family looped-hinge helix DNA binding protein
VIDDADILRPEEAWVPIVTVSPKYQVVIPREIRESLGLEPGQKLQGFEYEGRVEFVPVRKAKSLRGFARGIDTTVERERDRPTNARPSRA